MRRLPAMLLAALVAAAALMSSAVLVRTHSRVFTHNLREVARLMEQSVVPAAFAQKQETLEFRPLPPESVSRLESGRLRARRSGSVTIVRTDDTLATPIPPDAPDVPIVVSRSGDITRVGQDIHIEKGEVVAGDVLAINADVQVDGRVEGSVTAMRGDVVLSSTGHVEGDVAAIGGELREEEGSFVGGERVTAGSAKGRHIVSTHGGRVDVDEDDRHVDRGAARMLSTIIWLMLVIGVAWGIARFAPGRTSAAIETLKREPATALGLGALVLALIIPSIIALALVVALLCITIIGIPLAIAALIGYAAFCVLFAVCGFVVGATVVGEKLLSGRSHQPITLVRAAVWGAGAIAGMTLVSRILQAVGRDTPLHGLGTFVFVIYWIASAVVIVYGGGAWLRSEFATGTLGKWWHGRKRGGGSPVMVPAAAAPTPDAGTTFAAPMGTPPPSSPPEAFAPPPTPEPPSQA